MYAINHHFERNEVIKERKLIETALRYGVGTVNKDAVCGGTQEV